jgi:hypothetical protein
MTTDSSGSTGPVTDVLVSEMPLTTSEGEGVIPIG